MRGSVGWLKTTSGFLSSESYSVHKYIITEGKMLPDIPAEELAACLDRTAGRLLKRCAA